MNLRSRFKNTALNHRLVPQRNRYSCAAACLATIARLTGAPAWKDYRFFINALDVRRSGAGHVDIMRAARRYLPFRHGGAYRGGLALAYILHSRKKVDHAVVFLGFSRGKIVYYDPLDDKIMRRDYKSLRRGSDPGDLTTYWAASYGPLPRNITEGEKRCRQTRTKTKTAPKRKR